MEKVVIINGYKRSGGGEIYLQRLINELNSLILDSKSIILISPSCDALNMHLSNDNIIRGLNGDKIALDLINFIIAIFQINIRLFLLRPDILIINGDRTMLLSPFLFFSKRKIGIKHMLINSRTKAVVNKYVFKSFDKIVTISRFHIQNYLKWISTPTLSKKITLIYNSVDTDLFKNYNLEQNNKTIFLEIASLEKRKGQHDLLIAFKKMIDVGYSTELWFAGEGNDMENLKHYVKENNLENNVYFLGFIKDTPTLINKADVIILPSYDEGLPISILEALSCERPVISTNIAGIPEIFSNANCGFILNPGDINSIFESMCFFVNNKTLIKVMGANGRKNIMELFTKEIWIKNWLNLINSFNNNKMLNYENRD